MLVAAFESLLMLTGAFFLLVSGLGLLRLEDFYQRVHAPTKAATLGLVSLFGAALLALGPAAVGAKALLAVLFIGASNPVGAHYLTRTAYRCGVRPRRPLERDEYAGRPEAGEGADPRG